MRRVLHGAVKRTLVAADWLDRATAAGRAGARARAVPAAVDATAVRRVLVWSMDRLGDLVRGTAAIRALKHAFPEATLVVVAAGRAGGILRASPWIDELVLVDDPFRPGQHWRVARALRRRRWDLAVLLEADPHWTRLGVWLCRALRVRRTVCLDFGRGAPPGVVGVSLDPEGSWVDQFNRLAAAAGAPAVDGSTVIRVAPDERDRAKGLLADLGVDVERPFVLIHPGSNFTTVSRQWPPAAFGRLVRMMRDRWPHPVVITGVAAEREAVEVIRRESATEVVDLCGRLDLRGFAAVVEWSALCIMNDTGPLHVAQALQRPCVAILGPTAPHVVGIGPRTLVVRADLPCSPCAFLSGWHRCTNPRRWACLSDLEPSTVLAAVERQLGHAETAGREACR